jgi:hypothetical protein
MFRLIRWLLSLALLAGAVYFAVAVPLGDKTLWQHARAIAGTRESQELAREVKRKAGLEQEGQAKPAEARPEAKRAEARPEARHAEARPEASDRLSEEERRLLRKLIRDKLTAP